MADAMKVWPMNVSTVTVFAGWRLPALAFGLTLGMLVTSAAWAQGMGMGNSPVSSVGRSNRAAASQDKPPEAAPEAIPGAAPCRAAGSPSPCIRSTGRAT